jgi:hypothetical protein
VTALLIAAAITGTAGLFVSWWAVRQGWRPPVARLVAAGCLAVGGLVLLPHIGSADPESYAAYGHEQVIGVDPYAFPPLELAHQGDPYGQLVEPPWQTTSSAYGPLATLEQDAAARIAGGNDPRTAVWLLNLVGGLAFVVASLLLLRLATGDVGRARVAVLWAANPLLLWQLVAGAHLDTIEIALAVAAVLALRRRARSGALLSGLLIGAAVAVKLPAALVAAGLAWTLHRSPKRLAVFGAAAAAVVIGAYSAYGWHAFDEARTASKFVSRATPWRPLATVLDHAWGKANARDFIGACAIAVAIGLVVLLARRQPATARAMPAALLVLAYVLVTPYALPWYDGLAWALIVLLATSRLDLVLIMHTAALSLAYIPGRAVSLPGTVDDVTSALRQVVAPIVLGLLVALVVATRRTAAAEPG